MSILHPAVYTEIEPATDDHGTQVVAQMAQVRVALPYPYEFSDLADVHGVALQALLTKQGVAKSSWIPALFGAGVIWVSSDEPARKFKMTRDEYLARSKGPRADVAAAHREYYAQYVNAWVIRCVQTWIGTKRIIESTDPHFNDIPQADWDSLDSRIRPYGTRVSKRLHNADLGGWSLADTVCVAKEAAQQVRENANEPQP